MAQALAAAGRGLAVVAEPPQFGLERSPLLAGGSPVTIDDWAAWDPDHYAAPEIQRLAQELGAWVKANVAA
ncbi:hypothetical protein [Sinomonas mesophila]|uniref:hypothetical protein n=1 Tax=Sinomonas mesophila TaxID=1531955 RepID=UPI00158D6502|nr:hypothetical protein [Sinomonas mesophila]